MLFGYSDPGLGGCLACGGLGDDPPPPPPPPPPPDPHPHHPHHSPQWWNYGGRDWWPQGVVYRMVESQQPTGFPYGMVALGVAALALILATRK
jgi:hypothetical protein